MPCTGIELSEPELGGGRWLHDENARAETSFKKTIPIVAEEKKPLLKHNDSRRTIDRYRKIELSAGRAR